MWDLKGQARDFDLREPVRPRQATNLRDRAAWHPGRQPRYGQGWPMVGRAVREWDGGLSTECQAELSPQQQACINSTMAPAADEGGTDKAGMPPSKPVREHICVLPDVGVHQKPVPPDHGSGIGHDASGNLCGGRRRCGR
jgi:hypothetical protein